MTAIELLSTLRELGVGIRLNGDRIRVRAPKGALTPELQTRLAEHRAEILALLRGTADGPVPIPPLPPGDPASLSFAQQRLWFLSQLQPGGVDYNLSIAWRLAGPLDADALRRALAEILARHEPLRTTFEDRDGLPVQVVHPPAELDLPVTDLTHLPVEQASAQAHRAGEADAWRPFDLATGPLVRLRLTRLRPAEHVLSVTLHHILFDEVSEGLLYEELSTLYDAFREGRPSPLPPLTTRYADYAAWQRGRLDRGELGHQLDHWRARLAGLGPLDLPADRPRPPVPGPAGATVTFTVPDEVAGRLRAASRRAGTTMFTTLLAAFQALLSRHTGRHDIAVGTPVAGRAHPDTERLIGFFVNTLVLRTDTSGDPTFAELLTRTRATVLAAFRNQDVPFEKLVEELAPRRDRSRHPLFQIMFSYQGGFPGNRQAGGGGPSLSGLDISESDAPLTVARFDLTLNMADVDASLSGTVEYSTDLFDAGTVRRLAGHYQALLAAVSDDPAVRPAGVPLPSAADRAQLTTWSTGPAAGPSALVPELIAAQAARSPGSPAVVAAGGAVDYAELDARANRLAHELRRHGAGVESTVAVLLDHGVDLVVALLAIWRAGAAYLPLDPGTPAARLRYQLADSGARLVLHSGSLALEATGVAALRLDDPAVRARVAGRPATAPEVGLTPANAAYLIYTSGSTGSPKAVVVPHGALAGYLAWARDTYRIAGHGGAVLATSPAYDLTVTALFLPLVTGEAVLAGRPSHRPGLLKLTPSHLHARACPDEYAWPHVLVLGGEQLTRHALRAWLDAGSPCRVVNEYGPTEATVGCCAHELSASDGGDRDADDRDGGDRDGGPTVPIGRPIANTTCHVLDERLNPAPVGVPGELYVGGAGLARGYHGRPAATAHRFVANPFGQGERLYRTGDLARWRPDGRLEFLGRTDDQISLRGHRVEPAEVEAALAEHPGVSAVAVAAVEAGPADQRLTAYVVPADVVQAHGLPADGVPVYGVRAAAPPSAADLREHLATRLPAHLVPAVYVTLAALPLTPSGKLDRAALPAPDPARPDLHTPFRPPRTPTERAVAGIWCEVLGIDRTGAGDDFFELGGHSLLASQVMARVRARLAVDLPLSALFDAPVLADLAAEVERAHTVPPPRITRLPAGATRPLSFAQRRLWFLHQLDPGGAEYHIPVAARLTGPLDVDALRAALTGIVTRHEVLRTAFTAGADGTPAQVVRPATPVELPVTDLTGLPPERARAEASRLLDADAGLPFDLGAGKVLRARLVRTAGDGDILGLTVHHIAFDEWSMQVLGRELTQLYDAFREGRASPLAQLPVQYADFAAWQRKWLSGERLSQDLEYWRGQLADVPALELPVDRRRPAVRDPAGAAVPFAVPPRVVQHLRQVARRARASMFMTVLAAFQVLLSRHSGQRDIVVGSPIANRGHPDAEGLIGPFINVLALRTDLSGELSFADALARVRAVVLDAYTHQDLPFEHLVGELRPDRDRGRHPVFQVVLNYQAEDSGRPRAGQPAVPALAECDLAPASAPEKFDLRMAVTEADGALLGELVYRVDLFDRATVERLVCHFEVLLAAVAAEPGRDLDTVDLLSAEERAQLDGWARGDGGSGGRVCDLIAEWSVTTPDAPAVVAGGECVSYAELDARVNRLANHLLRSGIGPEAVVALCLPTGPDLVVAVLAVLRAGAAYLPLDPDDPLSRLSFQLTDSAAGLLLATTDTLDALPDRAIPLVVLDDPAERAAIGAAPAAAPAVTSHGEQPAYLIYTSGSTGTPKAVTVTNRALAAYARAAGERLDIRPGDRCALTQRLAVDFANTMLYGGLTRGATLCVLDGDLTHEVDHLKLTPSHLATLLATAADPAAVLPARALVLGGEATPADLATRLHAMTAAAGVELYNHYGPTECTVGAAVHHATAPPVTATLPIGRPLPHTTCRVLDRRLRPAPAGVPGELFVGGAGLARGYHRRPALTAQRFVADPFAADGSRLYRTGDLARWLADGTLEFLGRADAQLKIRGHRVEPAEVEAALRAHPRIADAAVTAAALSLVAHLVPTDPELTPTVTELRGHLAERLPEHAIPSAFAYVDALPRTAAGKIDRRALPALAGAQPALTTAYAPPRTGTERVLADAWSAVLRVDRVGRGDDFFDLGGHSLVAMQLIALLRSRHGIELPLAALFDNPTLGALARCVDAGLPAMTGPPLVPMNDGRGERPFFCVAPLSGSPYCYRALAQGLAPGIAFVGLQAPGVDDDQPPLASVEDLAAHYLEAVRRVQPAGPYHLGGWSMGSLVALEMARRLAAAGEEVGLLCAIAPAALRPRLAGLEIRRVRSLVDSLERPAELDARRLQGQLKPFACEPEFSGDAAGIDRALLRRRLGLLAANLDAARRYRPTAPYPGPVTVLLPREQKWTRRLLAGWRRAAAGGVALHRMPGSHNSMVMDESNARELSAWLLRRLTSGA